MSRVDAETRQRIHKFIDHARVGGVDPVDLLDRSGMLRYRDRTREDQKLFLEILIDDISRMPIDSLCPSDGLACITREGHRRAIVKFLSDIWKGLSHGTAKQ